MKHPTRLSIAGIAVSLSLAIISACSNGKQSTRPPGQEASTPPTASSNTAAGADSKSFRKWKTSQIIDAFKAAGLEVLIPRPMSKPQDYGKIPAIDVEATQFTIPALEEDVVGHIYSFASEDKLEQMVKYYSEESTNAFSWVYVKDNILVQLDGRLEEEKAKQYEAALGNVK